MEDEKDKKAEPASLGVSASAIALNEAGEEKKKRKFDTDNFLLGRESDLKDIRSEINSVSTCLSKTLRIVVNNWGGDEVARVEVRPSDAVIVGLRQIGEQLGIVNLSTMKLVFGEQELEESELFSVYGIQDWSSVQLTTIVIMEPNAFSETWSALQSSGHAAVVDLGDPLRLVVAPPFKSFVGVNGVEVAVWSGERALVEVVCVRGAGQINIGLLGKNEKSCLWRSPGLRPGYLSSNLLGVEWFEDDSITFRDGDQVGLLVDCSYQPKLRFFINSTQVHVMDITEGLWGRTVYPIISFFHAAEIQIPLNPILPPLEE